MSDRRNQASKRLRDLGRRAKGLPTNETMPGWDTNPRCPTPKKLSFDTQDHAETVLRRSFHLGRRYKPAGTYLCVCGAWHWTSRV